jgi:hypothetical protein
MGVSATIENMKSLNYKSDELIEWYWETDEYKAWLRLAHLNPEPRKCGYWCYDNDSKQYIYFP